jgi:hypothetical protein
MRLMTQKLRLLSTLTCKTTDGRVVTILSITAAVVLRLLDPIFERHTCPPTVKNTRDAKREIAKVYGVEVIS